MMEVLSPMYHLQERACGATLSSERYNLPANTVGRFVRITVNGNTENNWASITEIAVNGFAGTTLPPPSTPFNSFSSGAADAGRQIQITSYLLHYSSCRDYIDRATL